MYKINKNNFSFFETFDNCEKINIINIKKSLSPKIVIIGGVHGNEYGPTHGIEKFLKTNKFKSGNLYFIPRVNVSGLKKKSRYLVCKDKIYDINRNFYDENTNHIEKDIMNLIKDADFVLDFHEAYFFHQINKNSLGSTILPGKTKISNTISEFLVEKINNTITEEKKKFIVLIDSKFNIKKTLRDYCNNKKINYILVEITGQNNAQPLSLRIFQTINILTNFFEYFKILKM